MKFEGIENIPLTENMNYTEAYLFIDDIMNQNEDVSKIEFIIKRDLNNSDKCVIYGRQDSEEGLFEHMKKPFRGALHNHPYPVHRGEDLDLMIQHCMNDKPREVLHLYIENIDEKFKEFNFYDMSICKKRALEEFNDM